MLSHILRRLSSALLAMLVISLVIFCLLDITPGDAAESMVGESASAEQMAALRHELGLDRPLAERYLAFMTGLLTRGSLGQSAITRQDVRVLISARLPNTAKLALAATGLALVAGAGIGLAAALKSGGLVDTALMTLTSLGMAVPTFWSALLLIMLFSLKLRWLPVLGSGSIRDLILPAVTLALPTSTVVARLLRASLLEQLSAPHVRTAHAKGVPSRWVVLRHVLRNSLIPVINMLGLHLGHLVGGAFVVETIFGWPGLGRLAVLAIFDRDMPVVMGASITIAAIYLGINVVVDMLHGWLDPRVAHQVL